MSAKQTKLYFHVDNTLRFPIVQNSYFLSFCFSAHSESVSLKLLSIEFHRLIDEGIHDIREISVLVNGIVKLLRFLSE